MRELLNTFVPRKLTESGMFSDNSTAELNAKEFIFSSPSGRVSDDIDASAKAYYSMYESLLHFVKSRLERCAF